jgi:D-tyrosyl-tRNA(Tyr) deacylase
MWYVTIFPVHGNLLTPGLVSQFTLYGKMKKGNKPDFHDAAKPETARRVYDYFYDKMRESYVPDRVKNGVFQAMMEVELKNDGPVGVDYRSEDAAVHFAFLAPILAAMEYILTKIYHAGHHRDQYQPP